MSWKADVLVVNRGRPFPPCFGTNDPNWTKQALKILVFVWGAYAVEVCLISEMSDTINQHLCQLNFWTFAAVPCKNIVTCSRFGSPAHIFHISLILYCFMLHKNVPCKKKIKLSLKQMIGFTHWKYQMFSRFAGFSVSLDSCLLIFCFWFSQNKSVTLETSSWAIRIHNISMELTEKEKPINFNCKFIDDAFLLVCS